MKLALLSAVALDFVESVGPTTAPTESPIDRECRPASGASKLDSKAGEAGVLHCADMTINRIAARLA